MLPTISLIIPLFNKQYFILDCLQSIANQLVLPNEIIIINDCSTDNSIHVVNEYISSSTISNLFVVYTNQINSGPGITRNHGIKMANSEFVMFLDADDKIEKEHIKNIQCAISMHQPKLILTSVYQNLSKRVLPTEKVYPFCELNNGLYKIQKPFEILAIESPFIGANYCFQKEFFNEIEFNEERIFEDWFFCYKLLKKCALSSSTILLLPNATYLYTEDDAQSTSKFLVTDIQQLKIPQYYTALDQDMLTKPRKLFFSIWMFNATKRLSSFSLKVKFLLLNRKLIIKNFSFNKYFWGTFIILFLNGNEIEKSLIKIKRIFS